MASPGKHVTDCGKVVLNYQISNCHRKFTFKIAFTKEKTDTFIRNVWGFSHIFSYQAQQVVNKGLRSVSREQGCWGPRMPLQHPGHLCLLLSKALFAPPTAPSLRVPQTSLTQHPRLAPLPTAWVSFCLHKWFLSSILRSLSYSDLKEQLSVCIVLKFTQFFYLLLTSNHLSAEPLFLFPS